MKKVILGVLIVIVIGFVSAPFVNGLIVEKTVYSQLDNINARYADHPFVPKIAITRYDRGFSSSEIEWTMALPDLQGVEDIPPLVFVEKVKHGYLGASSTTSLEGNSWYRDFVSNELDGKDPLTISSEYQLLSGGTATISVEPFELVDSKNTHLSIRPGKLLFKFDRHLEHIEMDGTFEGLIVADAVEVKNISLHSDLQQTTSLFMAGISSYGVEQIAVNGPDQAAAMVLANLKGRSTIGFDETTRNMSVKSELSVAQIMTDDEKIADLRLDMGVNHLDADAFENFYRVYAEVLSDAMANLATVQGDPEQRKAMMQQQMAFAGMRLAGEFEKLLKKDLQITIDKLHVTLPQGDIDGDFALGLKKDLSMVDFIALGQQPQMIVDLFSFASNLSLPDGLIANQSPLLVPVISGMQGGFFEQKGDKLVHKAEIRDGKLLLNDKELVLSRQ